MSQSQPSEVTFELPCSPTSFAVGTCKRVHSYGIWHTPAALSPLLKLQQCGENEWLVNRLDGKWGYLSEMVSILAQIPLSLISPAASLPTITSLLWPWKQLHWKPWAQPVWEAGCSCSCAYSSDSFLGFHQPKHLEAPILWRHRVWKRFSIQSNPNAALTVVPWSPIECFQEIKNN